MAADVDNPYHHEDQCRHVKPSARVRLKVPRTSRQNKLGKTAVGFSRVTKKDGLVRAAGPLSRFVKKMITGIKSALNSINHVSKELQGCNFPSLSL